MKALVILALILPLLHACGGSNAPAATTKPPVATDPKPVFEAPPKQG
ncbi:hypothetical protein [Limnohabitans sp. Rim8]